MNSKTESQVSVSGNQIFMFARQAIYNHFSELMSYKVLLPGYLPIGVYSPFYELGSKKVYYKMSDNLSLPKDFPGSNLSDDSIIYYIHHFGMYNRENIERLKQLKSQGYYVLEDRALTLPTINAEYFGDATLYSFNKMLGIAHGGMIIHNKQTQQYPRTKNKETDLLRSYLSIRMKLFSHFGINLMPRTFFRVYNKISWNIINKRAADLPHWKDARALADNDISDILNNADYQAISDKITYNAGYLYDNIRQNLQLRSDRENYTTQAITGFPIIIDNPKDFQKYLIKNKIHGFGLNDAWRPDKTAPEWKYTFKHFLLPVHNDLRKKDLEKIVRVVNDYKISKK